jgi:adenylate cyclase
MAVAGEVRGAGEGSGPGGPSTDSAGGSGPRLSLKVKLSLLITFLVALTVALVSAFLLREQQQSLTEEMGKRGLTIATNIAASAKNPLVANDDLTLSLIVQDAMKDPDVVYVIFTDQNGRVLAHTDLAKVGYTIERPAGLPQAVGEPLRHAYADPKHGELLDFAVPLMFSRIPVGALYLGFSQQRIAEALVRARNQTLLISALLLLIGIAGAVALATLLSRPVRRLAEGTRAIAGGNFQIALPVSSRDEIGELTESFNQMAKSLREKEMIKRAFTRYVAREVVDEILKNPENLALKEERRDVTVLFCDMRGFTSLSERLSPEEVVLVLNEFYTLMIDTTFKQDGTLDKFLGDGVMAIFGAPILHPDHSIRAIRTAIAMQAGVAELSRKRVQEGKAPVAVGIGVSAGEAVAGTVGTEDRMEYTVIGDSVNLAARLESSAKPGQILISQRTYQNVEGMVTVQPLGAIKVKGKEEQVEVYEVLGLTP